MYIYIWKFRLRERGLVGSSWLLRGRTFADGPLRGTLVPCETSGSRWWWLRTRVQDRDKGKHAARTMERDEDGNSNRFPSFGRCSFSGDGAPLRASLLSSSSSFHRLALLASTKSSFPYSDDPLLLVTRLLNKFRLGEMARKRHRRRNLNGSLFRVLYKF